MEIRVLGCLVEKQRTTPDAYPLTLNGLRLACNQSTNRDPVVDYDEKEIRAALERLARRRLVRLASGHTTRATKYRHLLDDTLSLDSASLALLAVLMLRGPQTPGELKQRTERLHRFADLTAIEDGLHSLAGRGLVQQLDRRPGQKEERYTHLLAAEDEGEGETPARRPLPVAMESRSGARPRAPRARPARAARGRARGRAGRAPRGTGRAARAAWRLSRRPGSPHPAGLGG